MFRDEVGGARMKRAGEEGRHDEVNKGGPAPEVDDGRVGGDDPGEVVEVVHGGFLSPDESRSEGVEQDLEGGKERLSRDIVQNDSLHNFADFPYLH